MRAGFGPIGALVCDLDEPLSVLATKTLLLITLLVFVAVSSGMGKKIIYPAKFRPTLPFNPGVQVGDTLLCVGQAGSDLESWESPESYVDEVHQTLRRIGIIPKAAGNRFSNAVDAKVYLTDISQFRRMNSVYMQYFRENRPARTTVAAASLVGKARIEIRVAARK